MKMKRLLSLVLALVLCLSVLGACNAPAEDGSTDSAAGDKGDRLYLLSIGNSFSDDMLAYVYQIAKEVGYKDILLANLYIGGCSLETHYINAVSNAPAYQFRTNNSGVFVTHKDYKMDDALRYADWDYITMQQAPGFSGEAHTYGDLQGLINHVTDVIPTAKLLWHLTWAFPKDSTHAAFPRYNKDQLVMYNAIVDCVQNTVLPTGAFEGVLPVGTAIQNARTSYLGDSPFTRDMWHLSIPLGRYVAGLTLVHSLTGRSIANLRYAPSSVSAGAKQVAIEAAQNAALNPYTVTPSTYTG